MDSREYAKEHKYDFYSHVIAGKHIGSTKDAIFMAGSPGAGKTEVATELLSFYHNMVIIDADRFREGFPTYNGANSSEFQSGASWLVGDIFNRVSDEGYSLLLDGTFALASASKNIERVLKRNYNVSIYYVYQDPMIAWEFVKQREKVEGRNVPKERFINAYFMARHNLIKVKEKFGDQVEINILFKDFQNQISETHADTENIQMILPELYTKAYLEENLHD